MTRRWPWLLAWAVLTLLAVAAFRGVAWEDAGAALRSSNPAWLMAAVAANSCILLFSSLQWLRFLPRSMSVAFGTMFRIMAVTSTVSNGGPFLAGHAAGIHLLATRGGTGHAAAVSVKALDQLAEGVAKLALLGAVVLLVPLPPSMRATALALLVGVPALGLGLLVAAHRGHALERWSESTGGWRRSVLAFLSEVARQLEALRRPATFAVGALLGILKKVAEGMAVWAVLTAMGLHVPAWGVLLSVAAVNLSTMASVTPANLGIYEASALVAYRLAGVEPRVALGVAVVQHLTYLLPMAGVGWVVLALQGIRPRDVISREADAP